MRVILAFLLSFICGAAVAQDGSLRRLSLDPRTVIEKQAGDHVHGYVCSKGGDMWSNDELLVHLDSFLAALEERKVVFQKIDPASNFAGGNGIFHAFILWATLKNVRPTLIVESGVFKGGSSWLIHKATEEWNPILVFVDPNQAGWDSSKSATHTVHDFRGKNNFKDFAAIEWDQIQADRSNALVFFDDHMDQVRRLKDAHSLGFGHAMFDDNYIAGVGDMFTVKDACDKDGLVREVYRKNGKPSRRCDMFHDKCTDLSPEQARAAYEEFDALTEIYWEGPPLTDLLEPYAQLVKYIKMGIYEGPDVWNPAVHGRIIKESSKTPLLSDTAAARKKLNMLHPGELENQTGRYVNIAYIKLHHGHVI